MSLFVQISTMNLLCAWHGDKIFKASDGWFCLVSGLSFMPVFPLSLLRCLIMSQLQLPLPSWQFDFTNFLSYPALTASGFRGMIYASSEVRFYSLNYCFFCSSSMVNPASTMIDASQENTRKSAISPAKVDWNLDFEKLIWGQNAILLFYQSTIKKRNF